MHAWRSDRPTGGKDHPRLVRAGTVRKTLANSADLALGPLPLAARPRSAIQLQKPKQHYNAGFFDTHPTSLRRADYLAEESKKVGDTGRDARVENLRAAMASHLPEWLDAQIKLNDFGGTEYLLQQLAAQGGWTGELLFSRGELYREALAAGYAQPMLRRNLGMSLLGSGQKTDAQAELHEYLRLMPDATDAKAIQALLIQQDNHMNRIFAVVAALSVAICTPAFGGNSLVQPGIQKAVARSSLSAKADGEWNRLARRDGSLWSCGHVMAIA